MSDVKEARSRPRAARGTAAGGTDDRLPSRRVCRASDRPTWVRGPTTRRAAAAPSDLHFLHRAEVTISDARGFAAGMRTEQLFNVLGGIGLALNSLITNTTVLKFEKHL